MLQCRKIQSVGMAVMLGIALSPTVASATINSIALDTVTHTDTLLSVDVGDTLGSPGTSVPLSVNLFNTFDSIAGFQMSITLSRPDLMQFLADTVIDTCYECVDSACTVLDTMTCTLEVVPSTVSGTLVEGWDFSQANTLSGLNIRLTGIADVDGNQFPLPILPFVNGVLIKVIGQMECEIADTVADRVVTFQLNSVGTFFSDTKANTIPDDDSTFHGAPDSNFAGSDTTLTYDSLVVEQRRIQLANGSVTVPIPVKGDVNHDGNFDVFDVVKIVGTAFRGEENPCPFTVGDANCDGVIDVFDVVAIVDTAFRGGPPPLC